MKKRAVAITAAIVIIAGAITAFILVNNSLGNKVEIESVIPEQAQDSGAPEGRNSQRGCGRCCGNAGAVERNLEHYRAVQGLLVCDHIQRNRELRRPLR